VSVHATKQLASQHFGLMHLQFSVMLIIYYIYLNVNLLRSLMSYKLSNFV